MKYIGKSVNIKKRIEFHLDKLNKGLDTSSFLQNAWNKYGEEKFKIYVIELCPKNLLPEKEIYYISKLKTKRPNGYNLTDGGDGVHGVEWSEERKRRFSKIRKLLKFKHTEESKLKNALSQEGVKGNAFGKKKKNSMSKYFGVRISKVGKYVYWRSQVRVNRKTIYMKNSKTELQAAILYDNYVIQNNLPNPLNFPKKRKNGNENNKRIS